MEEKIFDLNEFVLPTKMFVVKNPTPAPKPKPGPDGFEIVYTDGKDIIVKKRATNAHLVLLFSKELFYLKSQLPTT